MAVFRPSSSCCLCDIKSERTDWTGTGEETAAGSKGQRRTSEDRPRRVWQVGTSLSTVLMHWKLPRQKEVACCQTCECRERVVAKKHGVGVGGEEGQERVLLLTL